MSVNVLYKTSARQNGGREACRGGTSMAASRSSHPPRREIRWAPAAQAIIPEQLCGPLCQPDSSARLKFVASQGGTKVPADASVNSTVDRSPRAGGLALGLTVDLAVAYARPCPSRSRGAGGRRPTSMPIPTPHRGVVGNVAVH